VQKRKEEKIFQGFRGLEFFSAASSTNSNIFLCEILSLSWRDFLNEFFFLAKQGGNKVVAMREARN
jgi:hypothetical protein